MASVKPANCMPKHFHAHMLHAGMVFEEVHIDPRQQIIKAGDPVDTIYLITQVSRIDQARRFDGSASGASTVCSREQGP